MAIKILNAGQVCVAPNRIYVQSSVYDRFVDMVADRMRSLEIGSGLDENVHVGPLINAGAREKVHRHLEDAVKHGARVVVGSEKPKPGAGFFMQPTLLSDLSDEAMVNAEETFGPLLAMRRFQTEEEVIRLANNTKHGLASYVFTRDVGRVFRMSEALESGMVSVNSSASLLAETLPFGGVKESGIGREGSKYGIESYVDDKLVAISF
jgi:succinate-semialdehyde dehydrogenase/glutarate-semialdehyde dehydrogenase